MLKKKTQKKIKTFDEYFEECLKNKKIPKDTPGYLREALERALREYNKGLIKEKSAFQNFTAKYTIEGEFGLTPIEFFHKHYNTFKKFLKEHKNILFSFVLVCLMEKQEISRSQGVTGLLEAKAYFNSETRLNIKTSDEGALIKKCVKEIIKKFEAFQKNGSGWYFKEVLKLEIHTADFYPTQGSSYLPLPEWIKNKRAIINIKNKDDKCFIWSVLRYLYPKKRDPERIGDLKVHENEVNTKGLVFPLALNDISKFEKLNPSLPGINVFSFKSNKKIYPLRLAERDPRSTLDLFFHTKESISHYSLIKNFSSLVRAQIRGTSHFPLFICKRCLCYFSVEKKLEKHIKYCTNKESTVIMPEKGKMVYFKNYYKKLPLPFVVYADFECFTKTMDTCGPNPERSFNYNYQKHEPSGFCFYVKGIIHKKFKPIIYTGKSTAKVFIEKLTEVTKEIHKNFYCKPKPFRLTKEEEKSFKEEVICHKCSCGFVKDDKVRDHCYFTGLYRGAAHLKCSLRCKKPRILPVIFHNLQGYDSHLFIKQLAAIEGDFDCIPSTEEKYISFSKSIKVGEYKDRTGSTMPLKFEIRFIDSFMFLQTSLANLVANTS